MDLMPTMFVAAAALLASALTMYSGFGLGTLLLPVFSLFFPVETAIAMTAVVHISNNALKISLLARHIDRVTVFRFGVPAILAATAGAAALGFISSIDPIARYRIGTVLAEITPVKLTIGVLMAAFALFELLPSLRSLRFERRHLVLGGLISGFFGGLSGHQGALRSAFLVNTGMTPSSFIGTSATIGAMVDVARIATYVMVFLSAGMFAELLEGWQHLLAGLLGAFAGVVLAQRFLHKITMKSIQLLTAILLMLIAVALGLGLL